MYLNQELLNPLSPFRLLITSEFYIKCHLLCHLLVILKVIFANSVDQDQTAPLSLIWVHTVCLYAKCKFEKFARRCSRRHKQTFSDADFLGTLRVNNQKCILILTLFLHKHI